MSALSLVAAGQSTRHLYLSVEGSKSGAIQGLAGHNFRLTENGRVQAVDSATVAVEPMSIGFVFDATSTVAASFYAKDKDQLAASIADLVQKTGTTSEYFIVGYGRKQAVFVDWTSDATKVFDGINRLASLENKKDLGSGAPIYDVLGEAFRTLNRGKHRKMVLFIFSDGLDNNSQTNRKQAIELAAASRAQIYIFSLTDGRVNLSTTPNLNFLETLSGMSGGQTHVLFTRHLFAPISGGSIPPPGFESSEIRGTMLRIVAGLSAQYLLVFRNGVTGEAEYEVKVNVPGELKADKGEIKVRHRRVMTK